MTPKWKILLPVLLVVFLLSGCALLTLEELYCLPKRSEDYENLQSLIDEAMEDLTYCAPVTGEYRQTVQSADLDGDGVEEFLLFAKDDSENPLKILIYAQVASGYVLMDTIEGYGFTYDFVDYVQIDDKPGVEIVVGRQVSEELPRSVSVYRFSSGYAKQLLSTGYSGIACEDMDSDGMTELLVLTAGVSDRGNGMMAVYAYENETIQRSSVGYTSRPVGDFQQVTSGKLQDGGPAVFVTSSDKEYSLLLDVFAMTDGELVNLTSGTEIPSVHNYMIFPEDIDGDGVVEIPTPVPVGEGTGQSTYILAWNSVDRRGNYMVKQYTYHHSAEGWYLLLEEAWVANLEISENSEGVSFRIVDPQSGERKDLLTIFALRGADRENDAVLEGKIVLYKGDSTVYAAKLGEASGSAGITEETLQIMFHPIRKEWSTEEDGES